MPPADDRPDDKTRLRELIAACLEHAETGGEGAVEAFLAAHPTDAPAIRERLAALRGAGMLTNDEQPPSPFPEKLGDFRLLRHLGGGGMGVVYVALQESLQRQVALKMIRPEHLYFPGARERFKREVESVARLQHPGIVPIYLVGESAGVPFFAMELVRGKTLAELVQAVHGRAVAGLTADDLRQALGDASSTEVVDLGRSWVEAVLRIVVQVADALAHASERGVLHRDIKPSNVMVAPGGRAILLDFGLATIEGGQSLTRTGHNVGSLPYMAPEQVLGQGSEVGPWTDVYGLGVLMFEMLTLKSPFFGDSSDATRARILAGEPPLPHTLNAAIPYDAETVCLKAISRDHRHRYRSAAELAADLRSFLELRPISAQRPGAAERVRTWIRRHPIKATLGVAAAVLLLVGPAAYGIQKSLAERRVRVALDEKSTAEGLLRAALDEKSNAEGRLYAALDEKSTAEVRLRAALAQSEAGFQRAIGAVDELLREVGARALRDVPQMDTVRVQLLEGASRHYARFLVERPADRALRVAAVQLAFQFAEALQRLGRFPEAETELNRARDLAAELAREAPGDRRLARLVTVSRYGLGYLFLAMARTGEAESEFKECIRGYRELVKQEPENIELSAEMADALSNLGGALTRSGRLDRSQKAYEEARDTLARLVAAAPDRPELREKLAVAWQALGTLYRIADKLPLARAAQEHVLGIYEALPASRRSDRNIRLAQAVSWRHLGDALFDLDQWPDAEAALNRSVALREGLVADHPQVPEYRRDLAVGRIDLGDRLLVHRRPAEAEDQLRKAIELLDPLARQLASVPEYRSHLGKAWMILGRTLAAQSRGEQAVEAFAVARQFHEEAIARDPKDPSYRIRLGEVNGFAGAHLLEAGDAAGAVRALEECVAILADIAEHYPQVPARTRAALGERRALLADACLRSGAPDRAVEIAGVLASGDRAQRVAAARILARAAGARKGEAADQAAQEAIALLRELVQESPRGIERGAREFAALRGREEFEALFR